MGISQKDRAASYIVFSWILSENLGAHSSDKLKRDLVCGLELGLIIVLLKTECLDDMLNDQYSKDEEHR